MVARKPEWIRKKLSEYLEIKFSLSMQIHNLLSRQGLFRKISFEEIEILKKFVLAFEITKELMFPAQMTEGFQKMLLVIPSEADKQK